MSEESARVSFDRAADGTRKWDVTVSSALGDAPGALYDRFVEHSATGHYAQTRAYARVACAVRLARPLWVMVHRQGCLCAVAQVLRAHVGPLPLPTAIIERGPVCKDPQQAGPIANVIARALRGRGVARLSVMPYFADAEARVASASLTASGFVARCNPTGPHTLTLRLPLAVSDPATLWRGPTLRGLRADFKQAARGGVSAHEVPLDCMPAFAALHARMTRAQGRRPRPQRLFDSLAQYGAALGARLFFATCDEQVIAGALTLAHGAQTTFVLGASTPEAMKVPKMTLAVRAAVEDASQRGATVFDLGGVPAADDPDPKRQSIARFKYAFARDPVTLVAEHTRWA